MSLICQSLPRLRLDPVSYESLRQLVLRRDGLTCPRKTQPARIGDLTSRR